MVAMDLCLTAIITEVKAVGFQIRIMDQITGVTVAADALTGAGADASDVTG